MGGLGGTGRVDPIPPPRPPEGRVASPRSSGRTRPRCSWRRRRSTGRGSARARRGPPGSGRARAHVRVRSAGERGRGPHRRPVDVPRGRVLVLGKGSKERDVPISEYAADALRDYLEGGRPRMASEGSRQLFFNRRGRALGVRDIRSWFSGMAHRAARQAGHPTHAPPQVRDPPAGRRSRHPSGPGAPRSRERRDHPAVHPRHASRLFDAYRRATRGPEKATATKGPTSRGPGARKTPAKTPRPARRSPAPRPPRRSSSDRWGSSRGRPTPTPARG